MEIDVVIEKAKLIKEAHNPEGIDNLIASLESYKTNKGDIRKKRLYNFLFGHCDKVVRKNGWWLNVEVQLYGLTANIVEKLNKYYNKWFFDPDERGKRLAGYVIDTDDEIYDYIFDVEFYKVSHELEILLYKHDFDFTGTFNRALRKHKIDDDKRPKRLLDFEKVKL